MVFGMRESLIMISGTAVSVWLNSTPTLFSGKSKCNEIQNVRK